MSAKPFPQNLKAQAEKIMKNYPEKQAALLPILHLFQESMGYIAAGVDETVAEFLSLPLIKVQEVLSFYTLYANRPQGKHHFQVCRTLTCSLLGGEDLGERLGEKLGVKPGEVTADGKFSFEMVECLGACETAPMLRVDKQYVGPVDEQKLNQLVEQKKDSHPSPYAGLQNDCPSMRSGLPLLPTGLSEVRTALDFAGSKIAGLQNDWAEKIISAFFDRTDALSLEGYISQGGYGPARKVVTQMKPEEVTAEVKNSNLRGLGGAGFPTGMKWGFIPKGTGKPVYLAVNADEGEPGTFKDRYILELVPHLLLEGIIICCYAVGCHRAYIYVRGEYDRSIEYLEKAIREAQSKGFLGESVFGTDFKLEIIVHRGAGAYICGEETALLESLEGKKGFPRLKPPFPSVSGLWGCPTVINNVETLSYLPSIIAKGAEWFKKLGCEHNGGLRLFGISGHVKKPGIYELPMGTSLRKMIDGCALGVREGHRLKAVVPGGLSSAVLTADEIDISMDFDTLKTKKSMLGSAGVMVMDETVCMVKALYVTMRFFAHESCGQCSPCREGTGWMEKVLRRILTGRGREGDLKTLAQTAAFLTGTTICALSDGAAMPLQSYVEKFYSEFEHHIRHGACDLKNETFFV